jgi:feruloyl-CoA synthase
LVHGLVLSNHTFGGNHNFGLAFNGGSRIDDGNPTPEGIAVTIENGKETQLF